MSAMTKAEALAEIRNAGPRHRTGREVGHGGRRIMRRRVVTTREARAEALKLAGAVLLTVSLFALGAAADLGRWVV